MIILGIETTCDETSVSIVENGVSIISNSIISQIDLHSKYGGVVPEVASRAHFEKLPILVDEVLNKAKMKPEDIDAIAIATEPGLVPALHVGFAFASGYALSWNKPLIKVDHLKAHIWANFMESDEFENLKESGKACCLLISGGHTQLLKIEYQDGGIISEIVGTTVDDAVGEGYDKVAKMLGLAYPGGPEVDRLSKLGNSERFHFPRPMIHDDNYNFSISGLKSHIARTIQDLGELTEQDKYDICRCFQDAVIDVLATKTINYAKAENIKKIYLAGGVACNETLRSEFTSRASQYGIEVGYPSPRLCTDNAEMIAGFAFVMLK